LFLRRVVFVLPIISKFDTPIEAMISYVGSREKLEELMPDGLGSEFDGDSPEFFYTLYASKKIRALDVVLRERDDYEYVDDFHSSYLVMSNLTNDGIESWVKFAELVGKRYGKDCCDFNDDSYNSIAYLLNAVAQTGIKIPSMAPDMGALDFIQGDNALDKYFKMLFCGEWCDYARFFIEYFEMCAELNACWGYYYVRSNYVGDDIDDVVLSKGWECMQSTFGLLSMAHMDQSLVKRLSYVPDVVISAISSYFEGAAAVVRSVSFSPLENVYCRRGVVDMLKPPKTLNYSID
jgi:hypothetical protein